MFTISESALRAFISDVCQMANEDSTGKNAHYIRAIRDIVEKTGVGADPLATEDENFLEYMTALSMGVTRLFRTEKRYRLPYIRSSQAKVGLPPLTFTTPSDKTWISSELDLIGDDLFKGEETIAFHVHRPLLIADTSKAADDDCVVPALYTSGDLDSPTVFKSVGKRLPSITGRKLPFKSCFSSATDYCGRSIEHGKQEDTITKHLDGTARLYRGRRMPRGWKARIRLWNTHLIVKRINEHLQAQQTDLIVRAILDRNIEDVFLFVPQLVSEMLAKYAPVNSISRIKPTVRLKQCLAVLL